MRTTIKHPAKELRVPAKPLIPEIENDLTRRELLVAAGLVALAPGCGSGGGNGEGASDETKEVEHSLGTSDVPVEPERVIAMDPYVTLPTALLVGAPVVGTSRPPFGEDATAVYIEEDTEGIEDVGWIQPSIETVATLDPDLIIGYETFLEEPYEQLAEFAPTVGIEPSFGDEWRSNVRKVARVLGREGAIEEEFELFDGRLEEFRSRMGGRLGEFTVSLVNIRALDDIRIYVRDVASEIMREAGLERPPADETPPDEISVNISAELLPRIEAGTIFYFVGSAGTNPEEAAAQTGELRANPLWRRLPAVENGRAYSVDQRWWFESGSIQAANLVLDDLFEFLVENE
ncbi:MAG: iron-siderophore ABC transporter substrate-binding protein [Rubrobacteraceae bacterium]